MDIKLTRKTATGTPFAGDLPSMDDFIMNGMDREQVPADVVLNEAQALIAKAQSPFQLEDETAEACVPMADARIERFLMAVVEEGLNRPADMLKAYRDAGFTQTGVDFQDKNSMRVLLDKKRVSERWRYLRRSEWEIQRPSKIDIKRRYEEILDDEDTRPTDRLKALDGMLKLMGDVDEAAGKTKAETTVIFNAIERPRMKEVEGQVIDAIARESSRRNT